MPTMVMEPPLEPCRSYSFRYPGEDAVLPRQLLVTRIHDIHEGRLTALPLCRVGQLEVTAWNVAHLKDEA